MTDSAFLERFISGLLRDSQKAVTRNRDYQRFPATAGQRFHHACLNVTRGLSAQLGWNRSDVSLGADNTELREILARLEGLTWLFENLADEDSRELLLALLRFRVLGPDHVALPLHTAEYWKLRTQGVASATVAENVVRHGSWALHEFKTRGRDGEFRVVATPLGFATTFLVEHYALRRKGVEVAVRPGDVVIDGGGCWGDTALYFADAAGEKGRVFCFEFDEENLKILNDNIGRNPALGSRVTVVEHPMWRASDEEFFYEPMGPGTSITKREATTGRKVATLSIDDLATRRSLERVDFIKMDIEGAEMDALRGAEQTIRRWKPRLALSVYHSLDDFFRLARFVVELGLGYRFYLGHATVHSEETVLFATAG